MNALKDIKLFANRYKVGFDEKQWRVHLAIILQTLQNVY